ncbi:MAG: hypothetical protein EON89_09695 [Brevundimonas sp.]|nr:MAG: hypothetical protein EON89_09695 [Brevundimonas sp.]
MTENTEDPVADIAWMRRLAEEGADSPMRGASILMSAGLIFGAASVFHWAQITDRIPQVDGITGIGWLVATLLFFVVLMVIINRLKRAGGVMTASNRATNTVWSALGWGIFAMFASMMALGWRVGGEGVEIAFGLIPSVIMVFYGIGWAVSAAMYKSRLLWGLAVGSFVAAPLLAALTSDPDQYLAYAAALFLLMALPGYLLMRGARR